MEKKVAQLCRELTCLVIASAEKKVAQVVAIAETGEVVDEESEATVLEEEAVREDSMAEREEAETGEPVIDQIEAMPRWQLVATWMHHLKTQEESVVQEEIIHAAPIDALRQFSAI